MTLRLILMRHAKSDWNNPNLDDFERPLNKRGRKSARAIGRWLTERGYVPEIVLCSASARTRETCSLVTRDMTTRPEVRYSERLYLASPETMFQSLLQAGQATPLMLLAHNPGCAILARALARRAPTHPRFGDFPTAATAILDFDARDWSSIAAGTGEVVDFVVPRDLAL